LVPRATNGERRTTDRGTTSLEVIAALVIFSLAAAGLAVVLPLAFGRAETWSEQKTLAGYMEKSMEEIRSATYESLPVGANTLSQEILNGRQVQANCTTSLVFETLNANGQKVWTEISGPTNTPINGLLGTYYDNIDFTGVSVIRVDSTINFNWGTNSPVAGIGADTFSVRWTGYLEALYTDTYTFYTTSDERVKFMINDTPIILNQTDHSATENSGTARLEAGKKYKITLEMADNTGLAQISLSWKRPSTAKEIIPVDRFYNNLPKKVALSVVNSASGESKRGRLLIFPPYLPSPLEGDSAGDFIGLAGLYFNEIGTTNPNRIDADLRFSGSTYCRLEKIEFDWADLNPVPGMIDGDFFGVRWTGYLKPTVTGNYYFGTRTDDGVRLWINNSLLIDQWNRHSTQFDHSSASIRLEANHVYPVTMDFYEWDGLAVARLSWSLTSRYNENEYQVIPKERFSPAYSPSEDTYVMNYLFDSDSNYGDTSGLSVANGYFLVIFPYQSRSYLKFNVSGINGRKITSAKLRMHSKPNGGGGTTDFEIRKPANLNWTESGLTWDAQPNLQSKSYGTYTENVSDNSFIEVPIDPDFFNSGDGLYGLVLVPVSSNDDEITFYSREIYTSGSGEAQSNFNPDYGPRLILEVEGGSANVNIAIQYSTANTNNNTDRLRPRFRIINNGTTPVALSGLKIRYWYTREFLAPQYFACYNAAVTNGSGLYRSLMGMITGSFTALNPLRSNTDYLLEVGFSSSAGSLNPGEQAELSDIHIYYDSSNSAAVYYYQNNDYSYSSTGSYIDNTKITGYYNDQLFYGVEPPALLPANAMCVTAITRNGNNIAINIKDQNNNNLSGVTVNIALYREQSGVQIFNRTYSGVTGTNGNFTYNISGLGNGTYVLRIVSIYRDNYTYNYLNTNNTTEYRFTR
jgi:type II secretory pathway pseudopilin PulG